MVDGGGNVYQCAALARHLGSSLAVEDQPDILDHNSSPCVSISIIALALASAAPNAVISAVANPNAPEVCVAKVQPEEEDPDQRREAL